jgi:primosomal protein N'
MMRCEEHKINFPTLDDYSSHMRCHISPNEQQLPKCPQCGDQATWQDASGTFWDSNAHYWRKP